MPAEVRVPVLGESVVEATVGRWLKKQGETVSVGEQLVELETDKVNVEVSADIPGVLEQVLIQEGATVRPGDVLGLIADGTGAATAPKAAAPLAQTPAATPPPPADTPPVDQPPTAAPALETVATPEPEPDGVRASPLAQRVADELGVDLSRVTPTGPGHRITRADVQAAAHPEPEPAPVPQPSPAPAPATAAAPAPRPAPVAAPRPAAPVSASERPETRQRLSRRRLTIARRLVEAQHTAAMLTTFNDVDMSAVMALRGRWKERFKELYGTGLGFMSFFTKAVVGALKAFPELNSELQGEELVRKQYYDIGVAIGDPEGLVVPVIRDADKLTFAEIEKKIVEFAEKSRNRALTIDELQGGTFTITNGGIFGSMMSTPILNPPQVGILGMHRIEQRPVAINGEVVIRPRMYVALSYDHRVVDGREAVQFLVRVKDLIEDPERLLLES